MSKTQKSLSRLNWTEEQERHLKKLREENGVCSWTAIANELSKVFQGKNRSGKQCRERYMNYIRFSDCFQRNIGWTIIQDKLLFQKFLIFGRKWVEICKEMPGKSQNCLKNRFYGAMRKISRRIIRSFKQNKIKQKKVLKQQAFIKILQCKARSDYQDSFLTETMGDKITHIQQQLIKIAIMPQEEINAFQIQSVVNQIHELNTVSKNLSNTKKQKNSFKTENVQQNSKLNTISMSVEDDDFKINMNPSQNIEKNQQNEREGSVDLTKCEEFDFCDLGFTCLFTKSSISQDLDKQVNQILNLDYEEPDLQFF